MPRDERTLDLVEIDGGFLVVGRDLSGAPAARHGVKSVLVRDRPVRVFGN